MIRNPFRIAVLAVLTFLLAAVMTGCGGSGGSVVVPPPPPPPAQPPSIGTQPTAQTVVVGASASFSVIATGTSPLSYQWRKDGANIAGATSASFTIASVAMSDAGSYTVVVSNTAGSATSNAATLTVNQPPAIGAHPQSQTITAGNSVTFSVMVTGTQPLSFQWKKDAVNIAGATSASFTIASVAMSDAGSYTVVVSNIAGSATSNAATLTVNQPAPAITSITPDNVFCLRECDHDITLFGSGFINGGDTVVASHGVLLFQQHVSSTEKRVRWSAGSSSWSPGFVEIQVSNANGVSNVAKFVFLGNLNTLATSATHAFQLDQGAGKVHRFRLSDGVKELEFGVGQLTYGISIDDATSVIVTTHSNRAVGTWNTDGGGAPISGFVNDQLPIEVSARGGDVCFSRDLSDDLATFPLDQGLVTSLIVTSIGDQPHSVAMTSLSGQLVCVVYNREDNAFSVVDIPSMSLRGFVFLAGLAKASTVSAAQGGWQLGVFHSGSSVGKAVLLAQADKKLVVVDLNTSPPQELRRIDLQGTPFRIVANEADGSVVVAYADVSAGLTRFEKVDVNTGTITPLASTSNLFCTGFGISSDGMKLYCANRDQFQILNNQ